MEIFLVGTLTTLIAVFIMDSSRKRRACLYQQLKVATQPPTHRK